MKTSKCVSCGANIEAYKQTGTYMCPYCDTLYSAEETNKNTNNFYAQTSTSSFSNNATNIVQQIPSRPSVNFLLLLISFSFGLLPAIIYLLIVGAKQRKWDNKYLQK